MIHSRFLIPAAVLVALVQIGILGSMIVGRTAILRDGQEVTLEVRPVDPRDLLRGDYVSLAYNISTLPAALFEATAEADPAERTVYVRLRPDGEGIARPVAARFGAVPQGDRQPHDVDMRGLSYYGPGDMGATISIDYGIERFYLPEGEGKAIEEDLRERTFRMKVAVDAEGAVQIKAFYDGDRLIYAEPIY